VHRQFETEYGYFTDDGSEYIITTPTTPKPWINVISNGEYGLTFSQSGGGFSWLIHSQFNRITRWHQDLIRDNWGKYLYIRDEQTGALWNPGRLPTGNDPDFFECHHGFGYSRLITEKNDIRTEFTIFVPLDDSLEIWDLKVRNLSGNDRCISITTYFEWCLGAAADHHREFHKNFIETTFSSDIQGITANKRLWEIQKSHRGHWNTAYPYTGFHTVNRPPDGFETDKERFLGNYGSLSYPGALMDSRGLQGSSGKWNDPIGSLQIRLELAPNTEERLHFSLGLAEDVEQVSELLYRYQTDEHVNESLRQVKRHWESKLNGLTIRTPDKAMDLLVNKWLKYQAISGRLYGRAAYYQQSGAYGFRDQLQDSQIYLTSEPEETARQIRLHARHQLTNGTVLHWWHPITEEGIETQMTDDLLWLPFILLSYLDETNDHTFLNEKEPYYDDSDVEESIYQHCTKAIEVALDRFSSRGLPLIGAGDWNDGLSAVGLEMKGESIWLGHFLYLILRRFSKLAGLRNESQRGERYSRRAEELAKALQAHGWDGEWYLRATKDSGEPVGSKANSAGRIYLNPQTWAVISESGPGDRQWQAMQSVKRELMREIGPLLLFPAYERPDEYIGYLSRYAPGTRENGGLYTHAATWAIQAFAMLGDIGGAYRVFQQISPLHNGMTPDRYKGEPYVTPGNIDGPQSERAGNGAWTWYTGSASWLVKVLVDWILGIRAVEGGLLIAPCIPPDWEEFGITRRFRGTVYNIHFTNPENATSGISSITLNGGRIDSEVVPEVQEEECEVEVVMGKV